MVRVLVVLSAILMIALGLMTVAVWRQQALEATSEARAFRLQIQVLELEQRNLILEQSLRASGAHLPSDSSAGDSQVGDFPPWYGETPLPNGSRPPRVP